MGDRESEWLVSFEALAGVASNSNFRASLVQGQVEKGVFFVELWLAPPGIIEVNFVQSFEVIVFGLISHHFGPVGAGLYCPP